MLYKPTNCRVNENNIIDANDNNNIYYAQVNCRKSKVYGYELTIYDKQGNVIYQDTEMQALNNPAVDGEVVGLTIPPNVLQNDNDYQISVRFYNEIKGSQNKYDTEITKGKIKGSTQSMLWVKVALDEELRDKILASISEYQSKDLSGTTYDYRREVARALADGLLDNYSQQIKDSTTEILINLDSITNINTNINTVLELRRKEILDNIKYDRYIQIDVPMEEYSSTLIIPPSDKEEGMELPKIDKLVERRKITWTETYDDWLYIELDMSGTNEETKGLTYNLADQTNINIYEVSGINTTSSFFCDLAIGESTVNLGDYVLIYDSPESALKAHNAGDLPGNVYKVTPVYKNAYKVIGVSVDTGEIRVDGVFPQIPKVGYCPRFFTYDSLTETYTESHVGLVKKNYKVPGATPYFDIEGGLAGDCIYECWDEPVALPPTTKGSTLVVPYNDGTMNTLSGVSTEVIDKYKSKFVEEAYILEYNKNEITWVEYTAPSPFKICSAAVLTTYGYFPRFMNLDSNYVLKYSIDGGTNWEILDDGTEANKVEAGLQSGGMYSICLRGAGETGYCKRDGLRMSYNYIEIFSDDNNVSVKGNLDYLWACTLDPTTGDPIPFTTSPTHREEGYAQRMFYLQNSIVDVSGLVYPESRTTNCFKDLFYKCGSIQKYPKNTVVYLTAEEALEGLDMDEISSVTFRRCLNGIKYTETEYNDGDMVSKFTPLTDRKRGMVFVDGKPYVYKNIFEVQDVQTYIFREYDAVCKIEDEVKLGNDAIVELKNNIKNDTPITGSANDYSKLKPYENSVDMYYDSRCQHKKGKFTLNKIEFIKSAIATVLSNEVSKFDEYYLKTPSKIDVYAFTPYYAEEECITLLGETGRWFTGEASRVSTYVGKLILEDGSTVYIKLESTFKVPTGTELYLDDELKTFSKTVDYSDIYLSASIGSGYIGHTDDVSNSNVIEGVINENGIKYEITSDHILKNGNAIKDNFGLTQLRYSCGRLVGLSDNKIYTSRDGINWIEDTIVTNASKLLTAEDTIVVLATDGTYISVDGTNWNKIDKVATDVAFAFGMFHLLIGDIVYSTTNFINFVGASYTSPTNICGTPFGLFVISSSNVKYVTQEKTIDITAPATLAKTPATLANPIAYPLFGEQVYIYTDSGVYLFDGETITTTTLTSKKLHNNYSEYINLTYDETVSAISTSDSWTAIEADVVDYRTLRYNEQYFNNSTTMILKGPIVCKDGYIAGAEYYDILTEDISVYNKVVFFQTPQRNIISSGGNMYSDIQKTELIGPIPLNCEYQIIDLSTSSVYDKNNKRLGYCDTPLTNNPMIEGIELFDDMDLKHNIGKYVPQYNVKCFLDVKEITDIIPLATRSDETTLPRIEFVDESFSIKLDVGSGQIVTLHNCVLLAAADATGIRYEGYGDYYMTIDVLSRMCMYVYDCLGNWSLVDTSTGEKVEPTYRYLVLETTQDSAGNLIYTYHEIDQPSKCISGNTLVYPVTYTLTGNLKKYNKIIYPYKLDTNSIMTYYIPKNIQDTQSGYITSDWSREKYVLQNGIHKKAKGWYKETQNSYLNLKVGSEEVTSQYFLNSNKWNYYNDDWATVYADIGGNNSKYLYIPIPESGTTKEALNVYGVEYGVDGAPSKGYIHINGKLYRVRGSSIVEDTGVTMIDIQKYQEQIIGGNPVEVVKNTKIESNNKERLFITPNINIKDDTTNPMQIIFNNDTRFGVTELDKFGDILLIENKGVIPYDENENIYPGCKYRVNTCFIDQDPTHRFTCKSKPDIVIKRIEGLGVNLIAEVREDIKQNLGNLTYHWEIREDFGWRHEGNIIYNEDIYNNNKLHINTLYEGRYYASCTVNGVKTADLLIKVAYPIDVSSEPIFSDESGLGYLIYSNPDYPHIYKRKHIYGISYTEWNPEDFYFEYLGKYTDQTKSLIDYDVALNTKYEYIYADDNNNTILYYTEPIERSNFVLTNLKDTFEFAYNYTAGSVTLNIDHTLSDSLSKYGKVTIKDKWYHSGTLSSLLGYISEEGYSETETFGEYKDMLIRWKKFAARGDTLLYRTPKGDKYYVKITESPVYTINDTTKIRETKIDFNWTEVENNTNFHELVDLKHGLKFTNISSVKLENNWKGDGIVYYSLDAFNWEKWNGEEITASTVYFRGKNNTGTYGSKFIATPSNNGDNGGFVLAGNMDYLLDYESNSVICGDCHDLFRGSDVEDASDLTMSYNLTSGAYKDMFRDCTKLEKLPKLIAYPAPAGSYTDMFNGCTAITWTTKGNMFKVLSNEDSMFTNCGFDTDATMPASGIPVAGQMYTYVPTRNKKFVTLSSADEFTFDTLEGWYGEGSIQYSTDTYKWYTYNYGEPSVQCSELKEYNNKHELYIRGIGNTYTRYQYTNPYTNIVLNCGSTVDMRGDFNDMLDYTTRVNPGNCPFLFCGQPLGDLRGFVMEVGDGEYSSCYSIFENCNRMTYAPDKISFRGKIPDGGLEYMFYDCISLLNAPEFEFLGEKTVGEWACFEMFYRCTSLTTVPDSVLSATTVEEDGYCQMFTECINLTEAPDIMATTIGDEGCTYMFYGSGIVIAPKIYATTIGMWCYCSMFESCDSLTTPPPILLATALEKECYCRMFRKCGSLTSLPELSALSLNESCYKEMFEDCVSLTTVPVNYLPVITLWVNCYDTMFKGCTLLNTAPNLPGEILQTSCYNSMFANCKALVIAPTISATQLAESCCSEMFLGCSSLTTFNTDLSGLELKGSCYKSMFSGTALTSVPSLSNASTTENSCYESMFENCSGLTTLPMDLLPAEVVATNAYYSMFKDCINLTNIPNLPAVGLSYGCYRNMFYGCSSLVSASINLPSTTVSSYGYCDMFYGCTSLITPPTMDAKLLYTYACTRMFQNCYSLESPIDISNVSDIRYGACQNMYTNCTSIKYPSNLKDKVIVSTSSCQNMYSGCSKIVWYPYGKPFTIATSAVVNAPFNSMFSGNTFLSDTSHTTPAENTTYYLFDEDTVNYITLENKSTSTDPYTLTPHYMMYKVEGEEWKYASSATGIVTVPYNKKVYLSGNYGDGYGINGLKITSGEIYVSGYISAMTGQPSGHPEVRKSVRGLFYNSTGLVDASGLILGDMVAYSPSYNMTYVYASLFRECENLVRGPVSLPEAKGEGAYYETFYYCKSLTNTPSITLGPTIYKNSYYSTFYCCTNLVDPPSVTFTGTGNRIVIEENGFKYMFCTCTKMTGDIFTTSGGTVLYPSSIYKQGCYSMYRDCTSLSSTHFSFPDTTGVIKEDGCAYMFTTTKLTKINGMSLSCMDVSEGAYQHMFRSCQVLETAMSNLPATTMKSNLYHSMFSSCYKLKNAPSIAGGTTLIDVTNKESVFERMFEDCKVLQNPAAINITALGLSTFAWMYSGCKKLATVPNLSNITSVAEKSCMGMFYEATIKTQATVPSATTLATECYYCMYYRATFTNASYLPTLPATTLAAGCYESMFKNASGVKPIPLPATVAADNCYKQMFMYCRITWSSTGTAYCLPISTIAYDWSFEMFGGNDGSIPEGDGTPKPNTNYYYTA